MKKYLIITTLMIQSIFTTVQAERVDHYGLHYSKLGELNGPLLTAASDYDNYRVEFEAGQYDVEGVEGLGLTALALDILYPIKRGELQYHVGAGLYSAGTSVVRDNGVRLVGRVGKTISEFDLSSSAILNQATSSMGIKLSAAKEIGKVNLQMSYTLESGDRSENELRMGVGMTF